MNKNKYLLKNSAIFAIGNIGTKLINFFLVPLYTYVLSSEEYGTVDLVFSICSFICPLVMCNISEAVMRFLMDKGDNENDIGTVAAVFVAIGIFVSAVSILIFRMFPITKDYALVIYFYIVLKEAYTVIAYYLRGKEMLFQYSVCSIICTLFIGIFNIVFLVKFKWGILGYFRAYNFAYLVTAMVAVIWGKEYTIIKNLHFNRELAKEMFKFSIALVPNALLWWLMNSSDRIMVSVMVSVSANGLYSVSYKIPSLLTTLSNIFMQAWTYSAIREKKEGNPDKYSNYIFSKLFSLMVLTSGVLIVGSKMIFKILFAPSYFAAWQYSPYLVLGFFFMTMSTFVGTSYYVEKNTVGTMLSALFGAIINIILNFMFIPRLGANGAAAATCISYFAIFCYRLVDTKKYVRINIWKLKFVSSVGILIGMALTIYNNEELWNIWLFAEFLVLCIINRDFLNTMLGGVKKPLKHLRE